LLHRIDLLVITTMVYLAQVMVVYVVVQASFPFLHGRLYESLFLTGLKIL